VSLLQAYAHRVVGAYGETTRTVNGIAIEIGRKALLLGSQDIPFETSAIKAAIRALRSSASSDKTNDPYAVVPRALFDFTAARTSSHR
jgi:hypothetical protein